MNFTEQCKAFERIYSKYSSNPPWNQKTTYIDVFSMIDKSGFSATRTKVLDLGCGSGRVDSFLKRNNFKVYGLDCSINALVFAKDNYGLTGLVAGNALKLPFKDSSFDLIIDIGLLHCIDPKKRFFLKQELLRVLKANGKYLLSEFFRPRKASYLKPLFYAFVDRIGKTARKAVGKRQVPTWSLNLRDMASLFKPDFSITRHFHHGDHLVVLMQRKNK